MRQVRIAPGLKRLGNFAFYGLTTLTKIYLSEGLETIGKWCIYDSNVRRIEIPKSVRVIEDEAFLSCLQLKEILIPADSALEKIGAEAFQKSRIERFTTPASLRILSAGVFSWCENLKEVTLNEGLEVLGDDEYHSFGHYGAFEENTVEDVRFPSTLRRIRYGTFKACKGLRRIALPAGLERIEESCFC